MLGKHYIADAGSGISQTSSCKESKPTDWLNIDTYQKGSLRSLKNSIESGVALAVSDGSYIETEGVSASSWIITTRSQQHFITAGALSPGSPEVQHSYRSELVGLLGILEKLWYICKEENIKRGHCTIACDGLSALKSVGEIVRDTLNTRMTSVDIISACIHLKEIIPIELTFAHVKGHQDNNTPLENLSLPSQLNIMMDSLIITHRLIV